MGHFQIFLNSLLTFKVEKYIYDIRPRDSDDAETKRVVIIIKPTMGFNEMERKVRKTRI